MNIKYIVLLVTGLLLIIFYLTKTQPEPKPDFFDTTFLRNSAAVDKILKQDGFFDLDVVTKDNLILKATMLDRSATKKVRATIISCPGFVPGQKEGMATLYEMLKNDPYNLLLLDTRGHGNSEGELLTFKGIKHYGESDYLDIVAAIQSVIAYNHEHNINQSIIVHGLCSGAFHTIKAVEYLKNNDPHAYECIKGIVFDSGWPKIADIAESSITSDANKKCKDYNLSWLQSCLSFAMVQFYRFFFKDHHDKQESITQAIAEIEQPILFIHGENDTYIPIHHVYPLIATSAQPTTWFIKDSTHAAHHLKHKKEYTMQLQQFIKSVL